MGMSYSLIAELDEAIQSGSSDRRMATLRRVTDLFLSQAGQYDSEQISLFDDVLLRLIEHIETRALAELGERLAPQRPARANCRSRPRDQELNGIHNRRKSHGALRKKPSGFTHC